LTVVFTDDAKRKTLNGIVHPIVTMLTFKRSAALKDENGLARLWLDGLRLRSLAHVGCGFVQHGVSLFGFD